MGVEGELSHRVTIIDAKPGEPVRHGVLKVTGRNVRGVPCRFELVEDEQETDVSSGEETFVVAILPAKMYEGDL